MSDSTSCIDSIFTTQPNPTVDSGVHPSLHQNCHHQVIDCQLNLNVELIPPYGCHLWDYNKAEIENIQKLLGKSVRKIYSLRRLYISNFN